MDRRSYLALVAAAAAAGCTSDNATTPTPDGQEQPADDTGTTPSPETAGGAATDTATPRPSLTLSATDAAASDPDVSLSVRYAYTRTDTLPTEPPTAAEATHVWLMVRMAVENTGDDPRELTTYQYVADADGEMHEPVQTTTDWSLKGRRVGPGETATGWVPFHIPDYATDATLYIRDHTRRAFAVDFERDRGIGTALPQ